MELTKEFWKHKKFENLSKDEWEALCDNCGKCCLNKYLFLGKTRFSNFHCQHLQLPSCRCGVYGTRLKEKNCIEVNLATVRKKPELLPSTCAYKLLAQGKDLPDWHPLISGNTNSVIYVGQSAVCFPISSETEKKKHKMIFLNIEE